MIDLAELIPRCHEASKANGWWDVKPNAGQALMLVVSELAEALEADRTGKVADWAQYHIQCGYWDAKTFHTEHEAWKNIQFKSYIKDSVGDELADAYIRLCDFAGGFDLKTASVARGRDAERAGFDVQHDAPNLGECLLAATEYVVVIADGGMQGIAVGEALAVIEHIAGLFNIDLATHIDLKLAYNATRGQRHGNKAY